MELAIQIGVATVIIAYGLLLSTVIPAKLHFVYNFLMAGSMIVVGLLLGLNFDALGLGISFVPAGILTAVGASLLIMVSVFVVAVTSPLKKFFALPQITKPSTVAYEAAVRIPLSTALTEEILFRGVLLAVFLQYNNTITSVVITSIIFGLWHILPGLHGLQTRSTDKRIHSTRAKVAYVGATILATSIAGVFFCWLRLLAGSIVAPWLVHWTINSSALLTGLLLHSRSTKQHDI